MSRFDVLVIILTSAPWLLLIIWCMIQEARYRKVLRSLNKAIKILSTTQSALDNTFTVCDACKRALFIADVALIENRDAVTLSYCEQCAKEIKNASVRSNVSQV